MRMLVLSPLNKRIRRALLQRSLGWPTDRKPLKCLRGHLWDLEKGKR
jgi:hypothetical protein